MAILCVVRSVQLLGDASRLDFQVFLIWPAPKRKMFAVRLRMFSGGIPGVGSRLWPLSRPLAGRDPRCYLSNCIQRGLRPRQPALTGNGGTTMWPKRATIGRSALPDACATWRVFYAFTTRFSDRSGRSAHGGIRQGCAVICASERTAPARSTAANCPDLFWYDNDEQGLMLTLGEWEFCPPPPTWREFFVSEGIPHRTEREAQRIWTEHDVGPEELRRTGR